MLLQIKVSLTVVTISCSYSCSCMEMFVSIPSSLGSSFPPPSLSKKNSGPLRLTKVPFVFTLPGLSSEGLPYIRYPIGEAVTHMGVDAGRDGYCHT